MSSRRSIPEGYNTFRKDSIPRIENKTDSSDTILDTDRSERENEQTRQEYEALMNQRRVLEDELNELKKIQCAKAITSSFKTSQEKFLVLNKDDPFIFKARSTDVPFIFPQWMIYFNYRKREILYKSLNSKNNYQMSLMKKVAMKRITQ